ncbi:MAG: leucine-rich repeat domain-containing protein [Prevotella sp.]|nr:leucine-rich repeat domain-containing protein [Prevotella sp.]
MIRLITLLASALAVTIVTAQEMKIEVSTPGTLHALVVNGQDVEGLTLTGTIDDSDLRFIRTLPNLKKIDMHKLKNKELGDSAFFGMTTLEYARLPKKLVRLGRSAFEGCVNLSNIQFSYYMEAIPDQMLKDCASLDKINIYNSHILSIGKGAFMNSGVRIIPLPQQLQSIGMTAFANCARLEQIRLPKWVMEIGPLAFANCKMLRSIEVRSETPPECAPDAFDGLDKCKLSVIHPELFRDRYPWSKINLDYNEYNGNELKMTKN